MLRNLSIVGRPQLLCLLLCGIMIYISIWRIQINPIFAEEINNNITNQNKPTDNKFKYVTKKVNNVNNIADKQLPKDDIKKLINLVNFKYLINPPPCQNEQKENLTLKNTNELLLLLLIYSAPYNFEKRTLIRRTWGSLNSSKVRILFLLGDAVATDKFDINKINELLNQEMVLFNDIVQGNFLDRYHNLTYKHVMALKWFIYYCPKAKYLLKTDDDVFVNIYQLIEFFDGKQFFYNNNISPNHNLIFCEKVENETIIRSNYSKSYVSVEEYPGIYFPTFCRGFAIIYSPDIVFKLYKLAQQYKYFWIEDVHITGTLTLLANITIISGKEFILYTDEQVDNVINSTVKNDTKIDNNKLNFLFTYHNMSSIRKKLLWKYCHQKNKNR